MLLISLHSYWDLAETTWSGGLILTAFEKDGLAERPHLSGMVWFGGAIVSNIAIRFLMKGQQLLRSI